MSISNPPMSNKGAAGINAPAAKATQTPNQKLQAKITQTLNKLNAGSTTVTKWGISVDLAPYITDLVTNATPAQATQIMQDIASIWAE
jgi:hypothetical protein